MADLLFTRTSLNKIDSIDKQDGQVVFGFNKDNDNYSKSNVTIVVDRQEDGSTYIDRYPLTLSRDSFYHGITSLFHSACTVGMEEFEGRLAARTSLRLGDISGKHTILIGHNPFYIDGELQGSQDGYWENTGIVLEDYAPQIQILDLKNDDEEIIGKRLQISLVGHETQNIDFNLNGGVEGEYLSKNNPTGEGGLILNKQSYSYGEYSASLGQRAAALGNNSFAMGDNGTCVWASYKDDHDQEVPITNSFAFGSNVQVKGPNSFAFGTDVTAYDNAFIFGNKSSGSGIVLGDNCQSNNGISIGMKATSQISSIAIGNTVTAGSTHDVALGTSVKTTGDSVGIGYSINYGSGNTRAGNTSVMIGQSLSCGSGYENIIIGSNISAKGSRQILLGRYPETITEDDCFVVANGYEERNVLGQREVNLSTILKVDKNGNLKTKGTITDGQGHVLGEGSSSGTSGLDFSALTSAFVHNNHSGLTASADEENNEIKLTVTNVGDVDITIDEDGYWNINGNKTEHSSFGQKGDKGDDGESPTIALERDEELGCVTIAVTTPEGETTSQKVYDGKVELNADCAVLYATLKADQWSDTAPYIQEVEVTNITENHMPIVDIFLIGTVDEQINAMQAYSYLTQVITNNGSITASCLMNKPEYDFIIKLRISGDITPDAELSKLNAQLENTLNGNVE